MKLLDKLKRTSENITILGALKEISDNMKSSKKKKKSETSLSIVKNKLDLSSKQAIVLALIIYPISESYNGKTTLLDLSKVIEFDKDALANRELIKTTVLELLEKNYIDTEYRASSLNYNSSLEMTTWLSESLKRDEGPIDKIDGLDELDVVIKMSEYNESLFVEYSMEKTRYMTNDLCIKLLYRLFEKNKKLHLVSEIVKIFNKLSSDYYRLIFSRFITNELIKGRSTVSVTEMIRVVDPSDKNRESINIIYEKSPLHTEDLIEEVGESFRGGSLYSLKKEVKNNLFANLELKKKPLDKSKLTDPKDIEEQELFYDEDFSKKVEDLQSFLDPSRFSDIVKKLVESGFKPGLSCLFYGSPGTGKTELVYQLAKQTGRSVMRVDLSSIRDKWVGESEKKLKEIFETYKSFYEQYKEKAPILLFNEADGIIGVRLENQSSAVDKMENSMQNILLQELEDFKGILIATTNLQGNLDRAFDRRFLYKLKFPMPDKEIKAKIWMTKIKDISGEDALELASEYDLSGGQINNISKKYFINSLLHRDTVFDIRVVKRLCSEEKIENRNKIGYNG